MGMLKYLNDNHKLIDHISYQWDSFSGDERSLLFTGEMIKDPIGLAYYHILESGIASNRMVPMTVKISLLAIMSNRIHKRQLSIPRGGRLGLWANETLSCLVRETHKFDYRLWIIQAGNAPSNGGGETTIGLYRFTISKRMQDTVKTDEDYILKEVWTFDSTGKMISKEMK